MSLRQRLILIVVLCVGLAAVMMLMASRATLSNQLERQQAVLGEALLNHLADQSRQLLLNNDLVSLNVVVANAAKLRWMESVSILSDDGKLLAQAGPAVDAKTLSLLLEQRQEQRNNHFSSDPKAKAVGGNGDDLNSAILKGKEHATFIALLVLSETDQMNGAASKREPAVLQMVSSEEIQSPVIKPPAANPLADTDKQLVDNVSASLIIRLSHDYGSTTQAYLKTSMLLTAGVVLLIAFGLAWLLTRRLGHGLATIDQGFEAINQSDYAHRIENDRHDAFGHLQQRFNQMAERLESHVTHTATVREAIVNQPNSSARELNETSLAAAAAVQIPAHYIQGSVLAIELDNLQRLGGSQAGQVSPDALSNLIAQLDKIIGLVCSVTDASVIKTTGSQTLLVFGALSQAGNVSIQALGAAQILRGLVEAFNQEQKELDQSVLRIRLGVDCSKLLVGSLGDQAEGFQVSGEACSIAVSLCAQCGIDKLLMSKRSYDGAGGDQLILTTTTIDVDDLPEWVEVDGLAGSVQTQVQFQLNKILAVSMFK